MVQFRLCEVPSGSALAWIAFARSVLSELADGDEVPLQRDVVEVMEGHLDEWETRAGLADTLSVHLEMPADQLEYLGHVFLQLSSHAIDKADERGFDASPPEGDEFFAALSEAVIVALEHSGEDASTEFAGNLRNEWPRTDRLLADGSLVPVSGRPGHERAR